MPSLYTLKCACSVLLVVALPPIVAPAQPQTPPFSLPYGPPVDSVGIDAALDLVLAFQMSAPQAEYAARLAGESENPGYIPKLKQIVDVYGGEYGTITLHALDSIWDLREDESYFFRIAQQYPTDIEKAALAIHVMGRDPSVEMLQSLMDLSSSANNADLDVGAFDGAISSYQWVLETIADYQAEPTLFNRIDLVLGAMQNVLTVIYDATADTLLFHKGYPRGALHPQTVWAHYALRGLYQQHPDSVLRQIDQISSSQHLLDKYAIDPESFESTQLPAEYARFIAEGFEEYVRSVALSRGPIWRAPDEVAFPAHRK